MASLKEKGIALLISAATVDVNNGAKQSIYVCPTGKSCIITEVVVRLLSAGCTTNSISFGWDVNASDVIADATYASFTGATVYTKINAAAGAVRGTAAGVFGVIANTPNTAATVTIDVYGYLY